jgi:hypothetical protein
MQETLEPSIKLLLRNAVKQDKIRNAQSYKLDGTSSLRTVHGRTHFYCSSVKYTVLKLVQRNLKVLKSFTLGYDTWV